MALRQRDEELTRTSTKVQEDEWWLPAGCALAAAVKL
jgi:hypothetical protein